MKLVLMIIIKLVINYMKLIKQEIYWQVCVKIWELMNNKYITQFYNDEVGEHQVNIRVTNRIRDRVANRIRDQIYDRVGEQVYDQLH